MNWRPKNLRIQVSEIEFTRLMKILKILIPIEREEENSGGIYYYPHTKAIY